MSRKTKKEKILAAYRRKLNLLREKSNLTIPKKQIQVINSEEKILSTITPALPKHGNDDKDILKVYFTKDLKKSLSIILFIIALEIIIYFVSIKGYLLK